MNTKDSGASSTDDPRFRAVEFLATALRPFPGSDIMQLTRAHTGRRRRQSARPRFDRLEERTLLSTWTVTDSSDNPTDTGSLRYAILNEPSGTTINFAPSVSSPITLTHGALNITANLDIEGPGADILAVDGNHGSTVFMTRPGVTATIAGLTIADGKASQGGGILNKGTLTVEGCTIANNSAPSGQGGGILNKGTLTLTDSTVANNQSASGGGMDNSPRATASLTNCTVADNSARRTGGGIASRGKVTLVNCTVAANSAKSGGGVFHEGASGPLILADTIVAGDRLKGAGGSGPDECGRARSLGYNLIGRTAGSSGWVKTDELRLQPLLNPLANNGGPTQPHLVGERASCR
jgi:predicted outer membrane repeat protein